MTKYEIVLRGVYVESWLIEADSPEEAEAQVRKGKGDWSSAEWNEDPDAEVLNVFDE